MRLRSYFYKGKKAVQYLRHFGPRVFAAHVGERLAGERVPYSAWYEKTRPDRERLAKYRAENRADDPLVSILVPAYETDPQQLKEMIGSVQEQTYENWELCLADASDRTDTVQETAAPLAEGDPRILYKKLPENKGIAENTNAALAMAHGTYIGLLDHDDLLAPHALRCMVNALTARNADMAYSDEDKLETKDGPHFQPHFKPDFNLDLLRSNNYITHFLMVKTGLAKDAGALNGSFDGAQDYDFILRCSEKAERIVHVPQMLYHWRTHLSSTADNPNSKPYAYEAGRRAVEAHLRRTMTDAEVIQLPEYGFYRVRYAVPDLSVSVIVTGRGTLAQKRRCVSFLRESVPEGTEILLPLPPVMEEQAADLAKEGIRILPCGAVSSEGRVRNEAAAHASGRLLLFLSDDLTGTKTPDFVREMAGTALRPEVGAVGAKLLRGHRTEHCGYVLGIGELAGEVFKGQPAAWRGYRNKTAVMQDLSAVSGRCMMVRKDVFIEEGGFSGELREGCFDIDLCLRLAEKGYLAVFDPYAVLTTDEIKNVSCSPEDLAYMRKRHEKALSSPDPHYNPNLTGQETDWGLPG